MTVRSQGGILVARLEIALHKLRLNQDIKPLSEFRANAASLVQQVRSTKRPLVLTQRGHSSAVVIDVAEYQRLVDALDLLRDVHTAERQLEEGRGVSHDDAKAQVMATFER